MNRIRMLPRLRNFLLSPFNRPRMELWRRKVESILASPPGSDDGFEVDDIISYYETSFSDFGTWEIVCEEVLDTSFPCIYFERARDELRTRGISDNEYTEMRRIAWLTAGWLNCEMQLWEWRLLNELDMDRAIEWQFRDGWISANEQRRLTDFVDRYRGPSAR